MLLISMDMEYQVEPSLKKDPFSVSKISQLQVFKSNSQIKLVNPYKILPSGSKDN